MSSPRTLDPVALQEGVERGDVRVLDVRTPAEHRTSHIPGSYNVPLDTLREHRAELRAHLAGSDHEVVLVCRSGQRATQAEAVMRESGMPGAYVLEGGIVAWQAAGGTVVRGRQRWELERQVRLVAGSIVLVSVLVSLLVPYAQLLAGVVGAGLTVAALSNSCLMGTLLSRLPYNRDRDHDVHEVLGRLRTAGG